MCGRKCASELAARPQPVNGRVAHSASADEAEPRLLLIHYLREIAGLTGPHIGCESQSVEASVASRRRAVFATCIVSQYA